MEKLSHDGSFWVTLCCLYNLYNLQVNTKLIQTYIKLLLILRYIFEAQCSFIPTKGVLVSFSVNGKIDRKKQTKTTANKGKKATERDTYSLANWSRQRKCISVQTNAERWTENKNGGRLPQQRIWQAMTPKVVAVLGINSSKRAPNPKLLQNI